MPKGIRKSVKKEAVEKVEKEIKALEPETVAETLTHRPECKHCGDKKEMHYGGVKGHCNTQNCQCLEFK